MNNTNKTFAVALAAVVTVIGFANTAFAAIVNETEIVTTKEIATVNGVTTTTTTVTRTTTPVAIPDFGYAYYLEEKVPYYDGWIYYGDQWLWAGGGACPAEVPAWKPCDTVTEKTVVIEHPEQENIVL